MNKGFTLIELVVVIAILGILSAIILFCVTVYINKSKDSSLEGNLAILVSSGEVYYNGINSYTGFCTSSVVTNAWNNIPPQQNPSDCSGGSTRGLCCNVRSDGDAWAACAQEFTYSTSAYCVDSRGVQEDMPNSSCVSSLTQCP